MDESFNNLVKLQLRAASRLVFWRVSFKQIIHVKRPPNFSGDHQTGGAKQKMLDLLCRVIYY